MQVHMAMLKNMWSTMMGDLNMWVDYRGSLSTVYNDGEFSTCG